MLSLFPDADWGFTPVRALSAGRSCLIEPASAGPRVGGGPWRQRHAGPKGQPPDGGLPGPLRSPGPLAAGSGTQPAVGLDARAGAAGTGGLASRSGPGTCRNGRATRAARGPSVGRHRPRPSRELRRGPGNGGCTGFRQAPLRAVYGVCEWHRPDPVRPGRTRRKGCRESGPPLWLTASLRAWRPPTSGTTLLRDRQPEASPPARAHAPASQPRNGTGSGGSGWR